MNLRLYIVKTIKHSTLIKKTEGTKGFSLVGVPKMLKFKIASVTIPAGSFELHSIEVRIDMVRPFLRAFRTFVDANAIFVRRERQAETKLSALSRDDSEFSRIHWRSGTRVVPLSQRASTFVNLAKLWKYENLRTYEFH